MGTRARRPTATRGGSTRTEAALAGSVAVLLALILSPVPAAAGQAGQAGPASAGKAPRSAAAAGEGSDVRSEEVRRLEARRVESAVPQVDGRLEEPAWGEAEVATGFRQLRPDPGQPATLRTEARVLYTDEAVYVGARLWDPAPDSIIARLSRRDDPSGSDRFAVGIDSYHDRRTAFVFMVNAAGVQMDLRVSDDTREDLTWDAVWESAVRRDEQGWVAEIRIPLSQLRYTVHQAGGSGAGTWGLNFQRTVGRLGEDAFWSQPPADGSALVSAFGTLTGLGALEPVGRLEVRPYTVVQMDRGPVSPENPFADPTRIDASLGGSVTYGLTPNLTLNATVNPDFGQVEADPAVVNLSAFETFFPEKRPFFQEGADIFDFSIAPGDSDQEELFYTRRIGRRPRGGAPAGSEFAAVPEATTILGAAKLSGKTSDGWSLGFMDAVTAGEEARYQLAAGRATGRVTVEPATNYAVGRVIRDFREGRSAVGAIATATNRSVEDGDRMDFLPSAAYAGGVDFRHRFGGGHYEVLGYVLGSHVRGPRDAMERIQSSSTHYFQRPDADYVELDLDRRSLTGSAASLEFRKIGGGHWRWGGIFNARSPGFEVNSLGFQRRADQALGVFWARYSQYEPRWIFRRWDVGSNIYSGWTFGGENIARGGNVNGSFQLRNFWRGYFGVARSPSTLSPTALRGGPAIREPGAVNGWFGFDSDGRAALRVGLSGNVRLEDETDGRSLSLSPRLTVQPSARMELSLSPRLSWNRASWQYVAARSTDGGDRYVFGELEQRTAALTARLNYTVSPDLSLQVYAQPFLSAGDYGGFMEVDDPRADAFDERFRRYAGDEIARDDESGSYRVDRDGDGQTEFSFGDPDFNVRQFRSNAVVRWQYRPGSTIFLVWSQDRADSAPDGAFRLGDDARALFDTHPRNVLLVKVEHWLGI